MWLVFLWVLYPAAFRVLGEGTSVLPGLYSGKTTPDICSSARWIFDGVAVAITRKFNAADRQMSLPEYNPDSTLGRGYPVACSMTYYLMGIPMV